jgi:excisionase family DNA binding protein
MDMHARPDSAARRNAQPVPRQLLLTPEQAADALAVCRTKVYDLIATGRLDSVRIGTSRRIPMAALEEFVQRLRTSAA